MSSVDRIIGIPRLVQYDPNITTVGQIKRKLFSLCEHLLPGEDTGVQKYNAAGDQDETFRESDLEYDRRVEDINRNQYKIQIYNNLPDEKSKFY